MLLKKILVVLALFLSIAAQAAPGVPTDVYSVEGKNYTSKSAAIRHVINSGKRIEVLETRCLILTNKLTLKPCPKNKLSSWDNEQFSGLKVTQ